MKQFFTIIFLAIVVGTQAQPVITGPGVNPLPNESFAFYDVSNITMPSEIPPHGPAGANVTWDFHNMQAVDSGNSEYISCSLALNCGVFPGSNLAMHDNDPNADTWLYYIADNNQFTYLGSIDDVLVDTSIVTADTLRKFPFTYNDTFRTHSTRIEHRYAGQYAGVFYDTTYILQYADAYGTLITPLGTFQNVLRIHQVTIVHDSATFTSYPTQTSDTHEDTYYWYAQGFHAPLFKVDSAYYAPSSEPSAVIGRATYTAFQGTAVNQVSKPIFNLSAYPNPTKDLISIKFYLPAMSSATITLNDAVGRQVAIITNQPFDQGAHELSYNVSSLPPGIYYLNMKTSTENITRKVEVL